MSNQNAHIAPMAATTLSELTAIADELCYYYGCDLETAAIQQIWQLFRVVAVDTITNQPDDICIHELITKFVVILMTSAMQDTGMTAAGAAAAVDEAVRVLLSSPRAQAERAAVPPASALQA